MANPVSTVRFVKIFLSGLFFMCLLDMPYGFYSLVRLIAMIGFAILAFYASSKNAKVEMIIYIGLALLFQPFFKIALGRQIWNIVDIIVGIGLLTSLLKLNRYNYAKKDEPMSNKKYKS